MTTAVARGDPSRKITVMLFCRIKEHHQYHGRPAERFRRRLARGARSGTGRKLGGQAAQVPGRVAPGALTDNVNVMAANLTEQVRGIVKVVTAVANGELTKKLTVQAKLLRSPIPSTT